MIIFDKIQKILYRDINGNVESIQPLEEIHLLTSAGIIIPIYKTEDMGRRKLAPVKFYKNGSTKSISIQSSTEINTSIGKISAELITFYEDGSLCRVFPLNGKLSGFWTETNEYQLAEEICIETASGEMNVKPICLHFYQTGEIKSVTFWPGEEERMNTPCGEITIKKGVSFYRSGVIASCEPVDPLLVNTPIGEIEAYDPDPNGMSGETNSLCFSESGEIAGLSTVTSEINICNRMDGESSYQPKVTVSFCNDSEFVVQPLKIEFHGNHLIFKNGFKTMGIESASSNFNLSPFKTEKPLATLALCH